jgi:trk system potassium uptake protein TrkA
LKILIVGAGEVGYHIASRLAFEHKDVVVVDTSAAALRRVSEDLDVQAVVGSGSSPVTLEEAGVQEAEIMLAVTDSDETNLVACLMADTISRIGDPGSNGIQVHIAHAGQKACLVKQGLAFESATN